MNKDTQKSQISTEELRLRIAARQKEFCREQIKTVGKFLSNPQWREIYDNPRHPGIDLYSLNIARAFPKADDEEGRRILHSTIFPLLTESDLRHIIDCTKISKVVQMLTEMLDDYLKWKEMQNDNGLNRS